MTSYRGVPRSSGAKIQTNVMSKIFVQGANNTPPIYWSRLIKAGQTVYPGYGLQFDTGSDGEDEFIVMADKSSWSAGVFEIDFGLISLNTTAYTAGDEVPGILFALNDGAIVQYIAVVDPGAAVDAWSALCSGSGTAGKFMPVTEPTLATEADNLGFNASASVGANGATGTTILPRHHMRQLYYLADPNAAYYTVAVITEH
jgi:hypothetical protein